MHPKRALHAPVSAKRIFEKCAELSGRTRIEREPSFGKSDERSPDAGSQCDRRAIGEKCGSLRGNTRQVSKFPIGIFDAALPPPAPAPDGFTLPPRPSLFQTP